MRLLVFRGSSWCLRVGGEFSTLFSAWSDQVAAVMLLMKHGVGEWRRDLRDV